MAAGTEPQRVQGGQVDVTGCINIILSNTGQAIIIIIMVMIMIMIIITMLIIIIMILINIIIDIMIRRLITNTSTY